jgi:hypothetical protein
VAALRADCTSKRLGRTAQFGFGYDLAAGRHTAGVSQRTVQTAGAVHLAVHTVAVHLVVHTAAAARQAVHTAAAEHRAVHTAGSEHRAVHTAGTVHLAVHTAAGAVPRAVHTAAALRSRAVGHCRAAKLGSALPGSRAVAAGPGRADPTTSGPRPGGGSTRDRCRRRTASSQAGAQHLVGVAAAAAAVVVRFLARDTWAQITRI